jgi:predicted O-linked N-acetylglucosamine transferase (SPINDLY family)
MQSLETFSMTVRELVTRGELEAATLECERATALTYGLPGSGAVLGQMFGSVGQQLTMQGRQEEARACLQKAIALDADSAQWHFLLANAHLAMNELGAAEAGYRRVLAQYPDAADAYNNLGAALLRSGRSTEALAAFQQATRLRPDNAQAHANIGVTLLQRGDVAGSIASFGRAVALAPDVSASRRQLGNALLAAGRNAEAEASLREAVRLDPVAADAHHDLGVAFLASGRPAEAATCFQRALELDPTFAAAAANLGESLRCQGRVQESLASYRRALALEPGLAGAAVGLGMALLDLGDLPGALESFEHATRQNPDLLEAHVARAHALERQGARGEALTLLREVLQRAPQRPDLLAALAGHLTRSGQHEAALEHYERALALAPGLVEALAGRAQALASLMRLPEAAEAYRHDLSRRPDNATSWAGVLNCAVRMCDWDLASSTLERLRRMPSGLEAIPPLLLLAMCDEPEELLRVARARARKVSGTAGPARAPTARAASTDRIRIAYLSSDFGVHPTSHLLAETLELHDRERFEIYGISIAPDDGGTVRKRIAAACERFVSVDMLSDRAAADYLRSEQIEIVVDLNGFTEHARPGILASRPAPIQVSYLGFPSTSGADYIDYILADEFVIPVSERDCFSEPIAYLPDCYQANDRRRPLAELALPRAYYGLPDTGVVFCCFNNAWKITREVFGQWMQILAAVEGSVLWLLDDTPWATRSLREQARAQGIDPERLRFAPRVAHAEHLARYAAADLLLDTFPCNAHTTASDAVWCGTPLITRPGRTFASRVAGSVLRAAELPELIVASEAQYVALGIDLGRNPQRLRQLREHLTRVRSSCALFDTPQRCRQLESAYTQMIEQRRLGAAPATFDVRAL